MTQFEHNIHNNLPCRSKVSNYL